ncbi:hypothetical protein AGR7C_pAt0174 [Agrobacterium deltaense Zutra 3/1]|uniref:Uncharacterized protein n=1 Tax=Agrobacterium deltaense Zutra 3/1 TaxID=1183427 RepID=A0A1S7S446_9HYPH|nr:hypothetical protein AGR7C_pAt0174 [Agrobacterium deltaense Zutra 3/1]
MGEMAAKLGWEDIMSSSRWG